MAVLLFTSGIPRFQRDILQVCDRNWTASDAQGTDRAMQKIPVVGGLFIKEPIPASDNVSTRPEEVYFGRELTFALALLSAGSRDLEAGRRLLYKTLIDSHISIKDDLFSYRFCTAAEFQWQRPCY